MPFTAQGLFSLVAGYFVQSGDTVLPSQHNPSLEDIASGLSQTVVRDGRAPMTGPLQMGNHPITGVEDGVDATDVATVGQAARVIGDFKDSAVDQSSDYLRRNGALYDSATYPDLAALLPALPDGMVFSSLRAAGSVGNTRDIIFGSGRYIALTSGTELLTSTDKIDWSPVDSNAGGGIEQGVFATIFLAAVTTSGGNGGVIKSNDGLTWAYQNIINSHDIRGACHDGTNFIVVGGAAGAARAAWSTNGTSWTTVTLTGTKELERVAANSTVAVAVGADGAIFSSANHGAAWTSRTSGTTETLNDVIWDAVRSLFIACGNAGKILTSPDGIVWTTRSSGVSSVLYGIAVSTLCVVVTGTSGVVILSSNGTAYTSVATGLGGSFFSVISEPDDESKFIIGGGAGLLYEGTRTDPSQFQVPDDNPEFGWIKAR